jgi:Tat protein secretion system quality control protein TatD with DNase activity
VIVYSHEADDDTRAMLADHVPSAWPVVLHGYTGHPDFPYRLRKAYPNLYMGFTGTVCIQ